MNTDPKPTILIVDDNPKNLQVLGNTLKMNDYKIEFAVSGPKAIDWIYKQNFDLILLDVMMPEMDGFDVCKTIRKDNKFDAVPIIFLTARTDAEGIVKGFEVGAQDYITKPFNTLELLARVKTQLELKSNREKLVSVNQWLENEVQKRTLQLEESNRKLEKANEDLLALDEAKTSFLSVMSNELRAPMNGIMGTLHLIKDQIDSKEMINLFSILDQSVKQIEKFSSYALQVTSFKTGKYQLNISKINLASLISFVILRFAETLKRKKAVLTVEIDESFEFEGDHDALLTAFANIIETALLRINENGAISINATNNQENLQIIISDDGIILPQQIVEQNFDEYKRDNNYPAKDIGFDFNLAKLIIEYHKGSMQINSIPGKSEIVINLKIIIINIH
jgi:two-component system, sensor histidine kinase and response regulator